MTSNITDLFADADPVETDAATLEVATTGPESVLAASLPPSASAGQEETPGAGRAEVWTT